MRFDEYTGSTRVALIFSSLLLAWWAIASIIAWWQPVMPPVTKPLFAVCENGRMSLRTAGTEKGADEAKAEADAACQPFTSRLIRINQASAAALIAIPGIGMTTAEKIVANREYNGHFHSAADLTRVSGIGAIKAAHFKEYLSFE
ncbi:MAG: helix-hairpin-helix domain-containing protein [Desulfobulbaceae bacterium]|nr:helix-hairpin-helix domain-containing protein [Desulfobulbaceae bacterium]